MKFVPAGRDLEKVIQDCGTEVLSQQAGQFLGVLCERLWGRDLREDSDGEERVAARRQWDERRAIEPR
jgi:hypothetical protein